MPKLRVMLESLTELQCYVELLQCLLQDITLQCPLVQLFTGIN